MVLIFHRRLDPLPLEGVDPTLQWGRATNLQPAVIGKDGRELLWRSRFLEGQQQGGYQLLVSWRFWSPLTAIERVEQGWDIYSGQQSAEGPEPSGVATQLRGQPLPLSLDRMVAQCLSMQARS